MLFSLNNKQIIFLLVTALKAPFNYLKKKILFSKLCLINLVFDIGICIISLINIQVEHIIRDDYLVEAMECLELYCDLILARIGLIETQK